jgi:hypothetical protein
MADIRASIGGDNSDLRTVLLDSEKRIDSTFKRLGKVGVQLGGFAAITRAFSAIVQHARDLESPMDANLQRAQQFARGLDEAKTSMLDLGASALGVVNSLGEWWGRQIAILKNGREQVELAEKIEADSAAAIKSIEQQRVKTLEVNSAKKDLAAAAAAHAESEAKAAGATAVLVLRQNEYLEAVKRTVNTADGSAERIKAQADEQRALTRFKEAERDAAESAAKAEKEKAPKITEQVPDQTRLADQAEREADARERAAAAEAEKLKNMREAEGVQARISGTFVASLTTSGITGDQLNRADSAALEEIVRRNLAAIQGRSPALGGGAGLYDGTGGNLADTFEIARLRNENNRINSELSARRQVQNDFARGGEALARQNFERDPLVFDDFLNRFAKGEPFNRQVDLLVQIRNVLKASAGSS